MFVYSSRVTLSSENAASSKSAESTRFLGISQYKIKLRIWFVRIRSEEFEFLGLVHFEGLAAAILGGSDW